MESLLYTIAGLPVHALVVHFAVVVLPIAAIRGEGTSDDYLPAEVPALPAFALQKAISTTIRDHSLDYWTGTCYTTNRRVWEHDDKFKKSKAIKNNLLSVKNTYLLINGINTKIRPGINSIYPVAEISILKPYKNKFYLYNIDGNRS